MTAVEPQNRKAEEPHGDHEALSDYIARVVGRDAVVVAGMDNARLEEILQAMKAAGDRADSFETEAESYAAKARERRRCEQAHRLVLCIQASIERGGRKKARTTEWWYENNRYGLGKGMLSLMADVGDQLRKGKNMFNALNMHHLDLGLRRILEDLRTANGEPLPQPRPSWSKNKKAIATAALSIQCWLAPYPEKAGTVVTDVLRSTASTPEAARGAEDAAADWVIGRCNRNPRLRERLADAIDASWPQTGKADLAARLAFGLAAKSKSASCGPEGGGEGDLDDGQPKVLTMFGVGGVGDEAGDDATTPTADVEAADDGVGSPKDIVRADTPPEVKPNPRKAALVRAKPVSQPEIQPDTDVGRLEEGGPALRLVPSGVDEARATAPSEEADAADHGRSGGTGTSDPGGDGVLDGDDSDVPMHSHRHQPVPSLDELNRPMPPEELGRQLSIWLRHEVADDNRAMIGVAVNTPIPHRPAVAWQRSLLHLVAGLHGYEVKDVGKFVLAIGGPYAVDAVASVAKATERIIDGQFEAQMEVMKTSGRWAEMALSQRRTARRVYGEMIIKMLDRHLRERHAATTTSVT